LPCKDDSQPNSGQAKPSGAGLNDQLDLSIAEIAVMWILHHGTLPSGPSRSLTHDIVDFYGVALDSILKAEALRGARLSDLRLIYFKGLMVARTHPKPLMIDAIRRADRALGRDVASLERPEAATRQSAANLPPEDRDMLAHIADALGSSSALSH
jgi:hypothetical protein